MFRFQHLRHRYAHYPTTAHRYYRLGIASFGDTRNNGHHHGCELQYRYGRVVWWCSSAIVSGGQPHPHHRRCGQWCNGRSNGAHCQLFLRHNQCAIFLHRHTHYHEHSTAKRRAEPRYCDNGNELFLHDYRVSLRKLRSVTGQMKGVFPEHLTEAWKKQIGDLCRRTNALRDF
ncbi:MAG: CHAD domain-containing protein, partial [Candidatus Kapaibacteriota bacterium]